MSAAQDGTSRVTNSPLQETSRGTRHYKSSQNEGLMSRSPSKQKQTGVTSKEIGSQKNKGQWNKTSIYTRPRPRAAQQINLKNLSVVKPHQPSVENKMQEWGASSTYIGAPLRKTNTRSKCNKNLHGADNLITRKNKGCWWDQQHGLCGREYLKTKTQNNYGWKVDW